ncbi:MAG: N-acetylneuraminate synthase family protein [Burkholderiales bacterium]
MPEFRVAGRLIGPGHPTYFIADIAANHDGSLDRAVELIHLAARAGADAAKFQHFRAPHIVSDVGFKALGGQKSHQSRWQKSVYEVYEAASVPWEWTPSLQKAAAEAGIHFFSAPYDLEAVDMLNAAGVPAFKMGSGDITWPEIIKHMARTGKPLFAATGASNAADVQRLMAIVRPFRIPICLMQCNTNYTGNPENIRHVHLNVLKSYAALYPDVVLGLSDHTPGHASVLGAVALGAAAIEKHFTDDTGREGPDHGFSMDPRAWREMVDRTRELEEALGQADKQVAGNEAETVVLQRRCLHAARALPVGHVLQANDIEALRPAPRDGVVPYDLPRVLGCKLTRALSRGEHLRFDDLVGSEEIWAVIPVFNEARTIGAVLARARAAGLRCLVVDDGSDDCSSDAATAAGADVVVRHPRNRGYAAALASGLRAAASQPACRWAVSLDADGQLDPADAVSLVGEAEAAGAALAVGVRPAPARVSERFAARILGALVGVRDPLCGLKAYRVDLLQAFPSSCGRRVGMELAVRAIRSGHRLVQRKISSAPRSGEGSRYGRGLAAELRIAGAALALIPVALIGARP